MTIDILYKCQSKLFVEALKSVLNRETKREKECQNEYDMKESCTLNTKSKTY